MRIFFLTVFVSLLTSAAFPASAAEATVSPSDVAAASLFELGVNQLKGVGVEPSSTTARAYFEKAASKGDARAQVWASLLNHSDDAPKSVRERAAFRWALKAAEQSHPVGEYLAGSSYLSGLGVRKNVKKAKAWLTRAANQGQREAMMTLASMSAEGVGSPPDGEGTYYWTKLSADAGFSYAIAALKQLQDLPDDTRAAAEARAATFKAALENPTAFNADDVNFPNVKPGRPRAPTAAP